MTKSPILYEAIELGDRDLMRDVIASGEDLNERVDGQTYLSMATNMDDLELATLLVENGADVNLPNEWGGETPIYWAFCARQMPMIELLRAQGAMLNIVPDCGSSLLHVAAEDGNADLLKFLLKTEAAETLEVFDYIGRTPLACAIDAGDVECARLLIDAGADVNAEGGDQHPTCRVPLQRAVEEGEVEIVRLLLSKGADPLKSACGMGRPPIGLARERKNRPELLEMIEEAIAKQAHRETKPKKRRK